MILVEVVLTGACLCALHHHPPQAPPEKSPQQAACTERVCEATSVSYTEEEGGRGLTKSSCALALPSARFKTSPAQQDHELVAVSCGFSDIFFLLS